LRHRPLERVDDVFEASVTRHPFALRRHDKAHRPVRPRRLKRAGAEEEPAIIGAAQAIARRRRQASLGKRIGEISADRGRFGHHGVAMADRRYLPHRVDREIGGRLHRRAVLEQLGAIGLADFLQHPSHDPAA